MWTMNLVQAAPAALLLAQTSWLQKALYLAGAVALFVVPFLLSKVIAESCRARDYRRRIGVMLFALLASVLIIVLDPDHHPNLGVDLKGGVILVYQVDIESTRASAGVGRTAEDESTGDDAADDGTKADAADATGSVNMGLLVEVLKRRLNPDGLKEIVIRPFGPQQVEIIVPQVEGAAIEEVKKKVATAGALMFRIVANSKDHGPQIAAADAQALDPVRRLSREVRDSRGVVARWVRVGRGSLKNGVPTLKVDVSNDVIRDARTGERITDIPREAFNTEANPTAFETWLKERGVESLEVLMIEPATTTLDVMGSDLGVVRTDFDNETLRPCVSFTMTSVGAGRMSALTSLNLPDKDAEYYRRLGIVLDNELLSAPRIMSTIVDRGQITGEFSQEEVDFLVQILRAGKLPAVLHKEPISQNEIGPMLGLQTIRQGSVSIGISLVVVLLFVMFYYRWAGFVACAALLMNLVMTVSLMILLSASLTLPGLAGLVLTVGMSVDANVLIFERIREERSKGAALRMAIRNGFARATTTIVDANLTTLLTGIVLYAIGTDQVKGFAVTLILGILMSMFTAIYCARAVFDIAERNRWITELRMRDLVGSTRFDFMSRERMCAIASVVLIVLGIVAVATRGSRIFDTDINGGVSVVMQLEQTMKDGEVRSRLDEAFKGLTVNGAKAQYSLNQMTVEGRAQGTIWKVDSSFQEVDQLKGELAKNFDLVTYSMTFDTPRPYVPAASGDTTPAPTTPAPTTPAPTTPAPTTPAPTTPAATAPESTEPAAPATTEPAKAEPTATEPGKTEPATTEPATTEPEKTEPKESGEANKPTPGDGCQETPAAAERAAAQPPAGEAAPTGQTPPATTPPAADTPAAAAPTTPADDQPAVETPAPSEPAPTTPPAADKQASETTITFINDVEEGTLRQLIEDAAATKELGFISIELVPKDTDLSGRRASNQWQVILGATPAVAQDLLASVQNEINEMPVWISASVIGGQVAGDTREKAVAALLASLVGIVAYIWIRFQKVIFGLAAVLALVHDVLITLGAIAISHYLVGVGSFLLIDEFKISLPVVAAFMTLIGYSLNDTIVVFDRIREVRGKSPNLTREMLNVSINQTLSRTLLTSGTTLLVILILYFMGGEGIHGFAFTLLIGIVVGTYSSVFIASPALLWMLNRENGNNKKGLRAGAAEE